MKTSNVAKCLIQNNLHLALDKTYDFTRLNTDQFELQILVSLYVLQVSSLLIVAFTFKIIAPSSLNLVDPFYCLSREFIERNCKATQKQLVYLHTSLLKDNTLRQLRTLRITGYI